MNPKEKPVDPDLSGGEYWMPDEEEQRRAELGYPDNDVGSKQVIRHDAWKDPLYYRDPPSKAPNGTAYCHGCLLFRSVRLHFSRTNFVYCLDCTGSGLKPVTADLVK